MKLIETIKIKDGKIYNIFYHNKRCNRSRLELFGEQKTIDLVEYITNYPKKGLFKCRILYNKDVISVEYIPYTINRNKSFKIVSSDIDYNHKYSNRDSLNRLKEVNSLYDEIIIEKDGLLTDTSIANIAFFDGKNWITPKRPLLKGTVRERLLDIKILIEKDITSDSIKKFSCFALMNAMIGFQIQTDIKISHFTI